ncbi:MAG: ribosome small subunit-dependent GTPase A [Bacillota bacterium]|nr:ribosome small subunit-dependent GTPase A [Bacillota bacterium]
MAEKFFVEGIIIKGIGGFYYVDSENKIYECKARGIFRKNGDTPYVGDRVSISVPQDGYAVIEEIKPRRNYIIRPPIANLDTLVIVVSTCEPAPNMLVIDKMTAMAEYKGITPVIVISKADLQSADKIEDIYIKSGIKTITYSSVQGIGLDEIKALLNGKITAFTGNSGVGKSTLLNALFPDLCLETGNISKKLGRGRHTTRSVELFSIDGGYVADTPGFSTVDIERYEMIKKEELPSCFPEFNDYLGECKFTSCSHTSEKGCRILSALADGEIDPSRFESYKAMYNEVKNIKEWES